jgi:hypothetical protein
MKPFDFLKVTQYCEDNVSDLINCVSKKTAAETDLPGILEMGFERLLALRRQFLRRLADLVQVFAQRFLPNRDQWVFDARTWKVFEESAKARDKTAEHMILTAVADSLGPILADNYVLNRFLGG